jgi:antibiotic biosynthesis monooxygenase (ABM) superfamily enzyme
MTLVDTNPREQPVKIVLQRRAALGAGESFAAWVRELLQSASAYAALEGSSVLSAEDGSHFILLRFASRGDLERWQAAPAVREILRRGAAIAREPGAPVVHTGLETWFALPGHSAQPPPAWKMALVTWLALLPQVLLLGLVVPNDFPYPLNPMISTAIPVATLTWWVMPRLTLLLRRWLYPSFTDNKENAHV